ncbi:hypothetical protein TIFTF001_026613 [Ficus carica]|uniref:Uncharacterized protein n=1 Tax=Ficus carica TaxID=3494 RepID=A0AA88DLG5_FICCA|nr:hypothetical protein TIFTF001_026613 [Ficus carica]
MKHFLIKTDCVGHYSHFITLHSVSNKILLKFRRRCPSPAKEADLELAIASDDGDARSRDDGLSTSCPPPTTMAMTFPTIFSSDAHRQISVDLRFHEKFVLGKTTPTFPTLNIKQREKRREKLERESERVEVLLTNLGGTQASAWKGLHGRSYLGSWVGTVDGLTGGDGCRRLGKWRRRWVGGQLAHQMGWELLPKQMGREGGEMEERADGLKMGRELQNRTS